MKKTILFIISLVLIVIIVVFVSDSGMDTGFVGSIQDGQEYYSTSTYTALGVPLLANIAVLKSNSSGILGSVVITGPVAGSMRLFNATSSTDVSSTTIGVIPASAVANTYTFDVSFGRGLILETTTGLQPTSTITWR